MCCFIEDHGLTACEVMLLLDAAAAEYGLTHAELEWLQGGVVLPNVTPCPTKGKSLQRSARQPDKTARHHIRATQSCKQPQIIISDGCARLLGKQDRFTAIQKRSAVENQDFRAQQQLESTSGGPVAQKPEVRLRASRGSKSGGIGHQSKPSSQDAICSV